MILQSEILKSRQNQVVKWAASLQTKKGREESGCFLAEGEKLAREAAAAGLPVTHVFISESKREQLEGELLSVFSSKIFKRYRSPSFMKLRGVSFKISPIRIPKFASKIRANAIRLFGRKPAPPDSMALIMF